MLKGTEWSKMPGLAQMANGQTGRGKGEGKKEGKHELLEGVTLK
jgi:hypothetical protein